MQYRLLWPFVEIAKQIGISDATVHLRVRRLIAAGIITKFTISVDNNLLGYDHLAFMRINTKPGFTDQVTEDLSYIEGYNRTQNPYDIKYCRDRTDDCFEN